MTGPDTMEGCMTILLNIVYCGLAVPYHRQPGMLMQWEIQIHHMKLWITKLTDVCEIVISVGG